jgi:hypothetical protein
VRELFWREWDPIGVNNAVGAEGEYDTYADKAYVMLMNEGRTAKEIADYLYYISSEYMGMGEDARLKELAAEIATKLVALKPTFELESDEPF